MNIAGKLIIGFLLISGAAAFLWAKWPIVTGAIAWGEGAKVSNNTLRLEKLRTLQRGSGVLGVGWAPDGHHLAIYSNWGQLITLWDSDGARLKELIRREGGPDYGNSFVFLSGGKQLLTAAAHSSREDWGLAFKLWDVDTGTVIRSVDGPEPDKFPQYNMPVVFAASADGQSVAFTSNQQNAPVNLYSTLDWSLARRVPIDFASNKFGTAMSVALSPKGDLLAIGRTGTTVLLVDLRDPEAAPEVLHVYDKDSKPATVKEMAKAGIQLQTALANFQKQIFSDQGRAASDFGAQSHLFWECFQFSQIKFYAKYRNVIDNLDTSPFQEEGDVRPNREDKSILKDPKKIVIEIRYVVDGLIYNKGFHPPTGDFAVEYASRQDLAQQCELYLDATGLKD